eukprot:CAMPEP_0197285820 /NCGR_PEP_ID=MMETSP0890-20130614/1158_1 /TAXON_ID=44058 ORGANISM="Aureoumbra lagunensis, Strain CCMP1510" /NCGR_SAMPLE_ID=MMETSP0890 /ASSEMBLY_ACC=CAM_ASM_000533 /LENGTH=291 /DNA_ID=CAMNT_0042753655 /DNA_START=168 /DNA_END=1043 /DNA_ORIENTATION=+
MIRLNKLSEVEELYQPNPTYIGLIQVDGMTEGWRHKITVWFDQLAESFNMSTETLSIATNYLDRYLSVETCDSLKFQLASVASIFLASKVEEATPFKTADFVTLSDGVFSAAELRFMELELLCTLNWHLHPPTFHTFINLLLVFFKNNVDTDLIGTRATRIAETTRLHAEFINYPPSMIAVASIIYALKQLDVESHVVTDWMVIVNKCNLSYTKGINAMRAVTECGIKLMQIDGGLLNSTLSFSCDAEVEIATSFSMDGANLIKDATDRKSPCDVMEIEQIEMYGMRGSLS